MVRLDPISGGQPGLAARLHKQLNTGTRTGHLLVLSEPEALVIAQLLEVIAANHGHGQDTAEQSTAATTPSVDLAELAQTLVVTIYDRLGPPVEPPPYAQDPQPISRRATGRTGWLRRKRPQ